MSLKALVILKQNTGHKDLGQEGGLYRKVRAILEEMLDKHAFAFDQCGSYAECEMAYPMAGRAAARAAAGGALHLHLWVQDGISELVQETAPALLRAAEVPLPTRAAAGEALGTMIQEVLGPVLYANDECFHAEQCRRSRRESAWEKRV